MLYNGYKSSFGCNVKRLGLGPKILLKNDTSEEGLQPAGSGGGLLA
jgi:hypothetical protein